MSPRRAPQRTAAGTAGPKSAGSADPRTGVPAAGLALAGVCALLLALVVTYRMYDPDVWQHLAVGRHLFATHTIPTTQIWAWPVFGQPDVMPSWLFRVLLWPFWATAGETGLFLWRWLTVIATFALVWLAARAQGARGPWAAVVLVVCALTWRWRSQVRPETLVSVILALQLLVLERHRAAPSARRTVTVMALPVLACVWANAHISYWLGFLMLAAYTLDAWVRERKPGPATRALLLAGLVAVAASFVHPQGWRALWQPFEYQLHWRHEPIYRSIPELWPVVWSVYARDHLIPLLGLAVIAAVWRARQRLDVAQIVLYGVLGPLALLSQRFLSILMLPVALFLIRDLSEWLGRHAPAERRTTWTRAGVVAAVCGVLCVPELRFGVHPLGFGVDWSQQPVSACDWMQRHDVRGRGFNTFALGGYLLWRFHPQHDRLPFMDIHQAGTREDRYDYAYSLADSASFARLSQRHRFDWLLVPRRTAPGDHLLDHIDRDGAYRLVFWDDAAALYLRRDGPMGALAARTGFRHLTGGERGIVAVGDSAFVDPEVRRGLRAELRHAQSQSPLHSNALSLLANLEFQEAQWTRALAALDSAAALDPTIGRLESRRALARDSIAAASARGRR